jgi:hypothetical protein
MPKILRTILIVVVCLLVVAGAAIFVLYHASQQAPEFYSEAISIPAEAQEKESELMLTQATQLHDDAQRGGRWQHVFQAKTINGWLAVDLPRNHPKLLPEGMSSPRVQITPKGMTMACRVDRGGFRGVISLQVSAFVESPTEVGLRIHKARLGAIPWSLDTVLKGISDAARNKDVRLQWRQKDGDPVALITLTPPNGDRKQIIHIDEIRLEDGALIVSGSTELMK